MSNAVVRATGMQANDRGELEVPPKYNGDVSRRVLDENSMDFTKASENFVGEENDILYEFVNMGDDRFYMNIKGESQGIVITAKEFKELCEDKLTVKQMLDNRENAYSRN